MALRHNPEMSAPAAEKTDDFLALTIDEFARRAALTDQKRGRDAMGFVLLGLAGETGTLLSEAKKKQRDRASYLGYAEGVAEELGDVLWYLAAVARRSRIRLSEAAALASQRQQQDLDGLTFHDLQPAHIPLKKEPTPEFQRTLLKLDTEVGNLVQQVQLGVKGAKLKPNLVSVMRCLIQAAKESGVTLEAAAVKNLHKIFDRWPRDRVFPTLFDEGRDEEEQLPRRMTIDIFERKVRAQIFVYQRSGGVYVGDRLTDNAAEPDDYRFHDVFHYAYAAVLGWSPVIRALLRLKRKSDAKLDEVEDGARANLIEEGVTTWIFGQAQQLDYFDGVKRGGLPLDMLKHIRGFVAGYEVENCPLWLWEEAILEGYRAFRFLRKHRQGRVTIDMKKRRLLVRAIPA
jgi:NTP pyrophosphatase (non-canonical NTP hydrolase)